jgi:lipopolysaccharide transport system permease protein
VAPIVELFRHAYLGAGAVDPGMIALSLLIITGILLIGILLFNRVERTFMDTV